jgi:predicted ATPase/class 3 adenylate cyclase
VRGELPAGTVTFLFTDVEGSTKLLHELGADAYAQALAEHRRVVREAVAAHGGIEVDTQGDAFFVAFPTAPGALQAAADTLAGLVDGPIRVRVGIHTGTPHVTDEGYVGVDVHRAARIAACGHGGQVLVSSATAAVAGADSLRDLGEHRLKDLSAPERIYQLGDGDFPPLRTLHQTNLPVPSTPFVGREKELLEVLQLLSEDGVRLLTLTGPGGTGKTRLATAAAGELGPAYPHGVWWVPLASLRDPELVLETASQTLGAQNGLAEHVGDRSMLLLFDNFEQVVAAADDVTELLAACPKLEVLVTSREPLHVTGEQEYPVPPLVHEEGVGFFLARARAVKPDFEVDEAVSEICRRLDDLPLALELAAARVKVLSAQQLLERLEQRLPLLTGGARDLPERQRTLRATIDWSYELLTTEEQRLFIRIGVFRGGCTLESAEQVADADLDTLQSLVDKSLVRFRDGRYWMLETIREYASERLDEDARRRHADHFLAFAEEAEPHLRTSTKEWLELLEAEHDNLRAAHDHFATVGETELALRLVGALSRFWYLRGYVAEGRRRLESALVADDRPTAARAKALNGAAVMAIQAGDTAHVKLRVDEALALHRALGDASGAAYSRLLRGHAANAEGDMATAQTFYEQSLQEFRELGEEDYVRLATRVLAYSYDVLGDLDRAREMHEENLERSREAGDARIEAQSLGPLGMIAIWQGRPYEAVPLLQEVHRIETDLGDRLGTAINVCRFAYLLAVVGHERLAARLIGCADARFEEMGASIAWVKEMNEETLDKARSALDDAALAEARVSGRPLAVNAAVALALDALATA